MDKQTVFERLKNLQPEHPYWRNKWMFNRPVFTNESAQGADAERFFIWVETLPSGLKTYINHAPEN